MHSEIKDSKFIVQAITVALGLFPIGIIFGILAQQSHWTWSDVFLLSVLGFSASGQFFYLKLASEQADMLSIFFVILMLNIRYIPMSLAAWNASNKGNHLLRLFSSHFISDESFAIEAHGISIAKRIEVRCIILLAWVISTVLGVVTAAFIPAAWIIPFAQYLQFPASAILALLAMKRLDYAIVISRDMQLQSKLFCLLMCTLFSAAVISILGKNAFWIPGIIGVTGLLYFFQWGTREDA